VVAEQFAHRRQDTCGRSDGVGDPVQEALGEVAVARLVLADGDVTHAAAHVAGALFDEPALPEAHELLRELAALDPAGGTGLYGPDEQGGMFAGSAAALAHLKAAAGDVDEAVSLLLQVAAGQPDRPWGASAPWLSPGLSARLDPDGFAAAVMQTAQTLDRTLGDPRLAAMGPFAELARAVTAAHPQHGVLLWASSAFMRRLREFDEAIDWASRAWTLERSLPAAAVLGSAWCRVGREAETVELWTSVLRDHPDVEMHVDLGELLARMGRFDEAEEWIRRGLAIDPAHPTAGPAVHGVRWARDRDVAHLVALADHVRAHPDHPYAESLLAGACDGVWLRHVPFPTEAVTKVLPLLLERGSAEDTDGMRFDVSALEVPSAVRAVHLRYPRLEVTVRSVREPDMRVPLRPAKYTVWSYPSGATEARPVPGPPAPEVAAAVAGVAQVGWTHPAAAYDQAVLLAGCPLEDLLGVLVHPPAAPDATEAGPAYSREHAALWLRVVQVWACLGIAHHQADEPWERSVRREVLVDLAFGPEDWVSDAALFALVATAWLVPDVRDDVAELVGHRFRDAMTAARTREVSVLSSLADLVLATPSMPAAPRDLARRCREAEEGERERERERDPEHRPEPAEERPEPDPARRRSLFGRWRRGARRDR
jgi:tetratricopeptide (TPR) repeat protein